MRSWDGSFIHSFIHHERDNVSIKTYSLALSGGRSCSEMSLPCGTAASVYFVAQEPLSPL